ncbi:Hpt domain-containing protein [Flavobacterium luteum]|uniref:Hpt domain-containing protein n=1 Tax=Flavobacterium luteum TaxID=2026654 RepID=A0A7J5AGS0_9FLAO|nr:Hpt domain-containing protein [Flavobacterium luteum]KAB1156812.1 Hpt domain-containing protein [Flavobacterium luteum]
MKEIPNLEYINQLSKANLELKKRLITVLKTEFPNEVKIYETNMASYHYKEAAENVHKLKHKIALLGLEKGYDITRNFEEQLKKDRNESQGEFEKILINIKIFLDKL